jgi:hydrogenase maturation protein HypF
MTSGNRSGEPIITDPDRALSDLDGIADLFLVHDRRIAFRTDDSVLRVGGGAFLLRRSRGYVPRLISLQREVRGVVLALGGDLKSAPALARGQDLHLCAYNGDLEDRETYRQFEGQIRQVLDLYGVAPDVVVHDLHPLYRSTRWAEKSGIPTRAVQHHFSHALSVMAEHGLEESLALSFDGTGYGTDGAIWGGEFLHATRTGFTRLGSFSPFPLPGGDEAVLHPPRTALALLAGTSALSVPGLESGEEELLRGMLGRGVNCPTCTSLGRVFDAAAAVLGLVERSSYEGEGPIRLEGLALLARGRWHEPNEEELEELLPLAPGTVDGRLFLADPRPLLAAMLEQSGKGREHELALLFHTCVARASVEGCARMRAATGVARVVLSGGVFQNALLRDLLVAPLINDGFEVFLNRAAPAGDGGLSLGQAWFEES